MEDRHRLLGLAALAFGGAFALHVVEYAFRLSHTLDAPHVTGVVVAKCLAIVQFLALALASFFTAQAFFSSPGNVQKGLRDAAALLAAAYGFGLLSAAFTAGVDFSEPSSHAYRAAGVLNGVFVAALMTAALLAATGFSRRDRARRDYLLGWTGIAFMAANLVALIAGLLRSEGYTYLNGLGTLTPLRQGARRRTPLRVEISCSPQQRPPMPSLPSSSSRARQSLRSLIQAWAIPVQRSPRAGSLPWPHSSPVAAPSA